MWLALRPRDCAVNQVVADRRDARRLVERHGRDSLAYFALRRDKSYFFDEERTAFLAYRAVGGVALVSGDPGLAVLNVMQLSSPASAVMSAIIFNAIVIVALIPLALRGVTLPPASASSILSRNLSIYGLGGIIAPFIGIKLIDLVVSLIPGF